jgi:hypothetical protein
LVEEYWAASLGFRLGSGIGCRAAMTMAFM